MNHHDPGNTSQSYRERQNLSDINISIGSQKAWEGVRALDPHETCARAMVSFDTRTREYSLKSFGAEFHISLDNRIVSSLDTQGVILLGRPEYFFELSVLWYLITAKEIPLSGRLMKPVHMKGGQIFARGTHILPLGELAEKYGTNKVAFLQRGREFGGKEIDSADAALRISAFPRVPVVLSLWLADEEFPSRADLMFDSTCDKQLPTDVIWSIATMTVLMML